MSDTIWMSDTIKVALTTNTYTPDQDAHEYFSSVTNELSGNGYVAGGNTLSGKGLSYDAATNQSRLTASNTTFTASAGNVITARRAVVYKSTGTPSTSPLLGWVDFGADTSSGTGGDLVLAWDATGVLRVTAS